jgi:asparagine synthase (glutamine-hydrolysing)
MALDLGSILSDRLGSLTGDSQSLTFLIQPRKPMLGGQGRYVITYNGEVYNHAEIKKEINQINHPQIQWTTDHSDTEVVLNAFIVWGTEALHKLRGMFAFAIWDNEKEELFVVRDRIGIKPCYHMQIDGRFVFASEIKALLKDPGYKPAVNKKAFYHYLSFLTSPAPETLFKGIYKLPAGHHMLIKKGEDPIVTCYWDVFDNVQDSSHLDEETIAAKIREELTTAVDYRKIGDVPVGVFLSGGVDSSTNAAMFSKQGKEKIKTFSIGYDADYGTYKNELYYAKEVAELIGSDHFEQRLNVDDLIDFLPKMVELQDEPIADPVCVPVYYVSKLARDNGVTVCQVGEGADELFWGYTSWKVKLKLEELNQWPVPIAIKKAGLQVLKAFGQERSLPYEWLRRGASQLPVFWGGAEAFTEAEKQALISDSLKTELGDCSSWDVLDPIYKKFQQTCPKPTPLNWMSYLDLKMRLPELLLMRVDKMSMGVSLEARVPFLDHRFVELAMGVDPKLKTKNSVSKYILKKAVIGLIPDKIINRKKQGFGVPVYEWLFDKLGDKIEKELIEFCEQEDFFNRGYVEKLIQKKASSQLWYLYNFVLWHKRFF